MLKKSLALLMLGAAFSTMASADWNHGRDYGRVIRVEPAVSIGFHGGRNHFQILYEFGGDRYWTYSDYRPGPWVAVPPPRYAYRWDDRRPWWRAQERREHDHHHGDWNDDHRGDWRHGDHDRH
jgi:hypothetical protein